MTQTLSKDEEDLIFDSAEEQLRGSPVKRWHITSLPPVLPYLLHYKGGPRNVKDLLDKALVFRESREGKAYRKLSRRLESEGIAARRAEDLVDVEHKLALDQLKPYSRIEPGKSRSLEISYSLEHVGIPGKFTTKVGLPIPTWLRIWWNDHIPFGSIRKSLRRMWMEAESYKNFSNTLRDVWARAG